MNLDIGEILKKWPYEPGQVTARRIRGSDGREKIQLRLDLGLLQMETTGRPDGRRPHGCESLLDYHTKQLRAHRQAHGTNEGFALDEQACELLRSEGAMYYHRYLAEFVLEDYEAVQRDTVRNLRLFDLCHRYAEEESDRTILEQFRPYVLMMLARARGSAAARDGRPRAALAAIRQGIQSIETFYTRYGPEDRSEPAAEVAILTAMAKEIEGRMPVDPVRRLRRKLARAVREERYEDAAVLRDQLRRATDGADAEDAGPTND
jgi:hypothetical protein